MADGLSTGEALNEANSFGDKDVEVITQESEWSGAVDAGIDNDPEQLDEHASEIYQERERRLTRGAEELEKELMIGDTDVAVQVEASEWAEDGGDDAADDTDDRIEEHATEVYQARERRLTRGTEELEKEVMLGDTDVAVVVQASEWAEDGDDDNPDEFVEHASEVYEARERRLTRGTEELEKEMVIGDTDVSVVVQASEWAEDGGDANDDCDQLDEHASEVYQARERRLTRGTEELEKELVMGDTDVAIVVETSEWAADVADDVDDPVEQYASEVYEARERRLTRGTEELEKELMIADAEVSIVAENSEWAKLSAEDEDDQETSGQFDQHASEVFEARERRLTRGVEELEKAIAEDADLAASQDTPALGTMEHLRRSWYLNAADAEELAAKLGQDGDAKIDKGLDDLEALAQKLADGYPSFVLRKKAEIEFLSLIERLRDILQAIVKHDDRDLLIRVLGSPYTRLARVRYLLECVALSGERAADARWTDLQQSANAVESVLRNLDGAQKFRAWRELKKEGLFQPAFEDATTVGDSSSSVSLRRKWKRHLDRELENSELGEARVWTSAVKRRPTGRTWTARSSGPPAVRPQAARPASRVDVASPPPVARPAAANGRVWVSSQIQPTELVLSLEDYDSSQWRPSLNLRKSTTTTRVPRRSPSPAVASKPPSRSQSNRRAR